MLFRTITEIIHDENMQPAKIFLFICISLAYEVFSIRKQAVVNI